jgi:hypothetical protein
MRQPAGKVEGQAAEELLIGCQRGEWQGRTEPLQLLRQQLVNLLGAYWRQRRALPVRGRQQGPGTRRRGHRLARWSLRIHGASHFCSREEKEGPDQLDKY